MRQTICKYPTPSFYQQLTICRDFATVQSYQDIHGHVKQGSAKFLKNDFYNMGDDAGLLGIVSIRDPLHHRDVRRSLSNAFSAKALRLQTDVVLHYVDMFIDQIKRVGDTHDGIDANEVSH